jgi:hypothetical protein
LYAGCQRLMYHSPVLITGTMRAAVPCANRICEVSACSRCSCTPVAGVGASQSRPTGTAIRSPVARHYRDVERLPIAEIARRLGRAPATVKAYLYDPTGEKARAVKARYRGYCRTCGADTSPRNGKGDAYAYYRRCRPGAAASKWTRERVGAAMRAWRDLYGHPPSSYDRSRTHARRRGAEALRRLELGTWPAPATVESLYATWAAALTDAFPC